MSCLIIQGGPGPIGPTGSLGATGPTGTASAEARGISGRFTEIPDSVTATPVTLLLDPPAYVNGFTYAPTGITIQEDGAYRVGYTLHVLDTIAGVNTSVINLQGWLTVTGSPQSDIIIYNAEHNFPSASITLTASQILELSADDIIAFRYELASSVFGTFTISSVYTSYSIMPIE